MPGKTLIIGYGNPDREDDGVAWHILDSLAEQLGRTLSDASSANPDMPSPQLVCELQLTPEMAEIVSQFNHVCFVDAHTGAYQEDLRFETIQSRFQNSPFTHHMTPESCLMLAESLFGHTPQAVVLSVRGYEFGFARALSPQTSRLADQAIESLLRWLDQDNDTAQ